MTLFDLVAGQWAIIPERLDELQAIYATHLRGEKIDVAAIEARIGQPLASQQRAYEVRPGGVAVLPIEGIMAPKANVMMRVSGGVSTQMATAQVRSIRADPSVRSAALVWDSPGGSALGLPAFAAEIAALAAEKPTVSLSQGVMASAAYWAGSAANAVFMEGGTDQVGSIGVYQRLTWDAAEANAHEMIRGKYKRVSVNGQAPSAEIIAHHEAQLDHVYKVFVDTVATHRGTTSDLVLQHMAEGQLFIGQQAISAGLVDGVSTVDAMVERLATNPSQFAKRRKAVFALGGLEQSASAGAAHEDAQEGSTPPVDDAANSTASEGATMAEPITRESLERDHAALFAQLRSDFMAQGATAERDRILAVRGQAMPGHEELIERLAFDGTTSGPEAAAAVLQAERGLRNAAAAAHRQDAPPAARTDAAAAAAVSDQESGDAKTDARKLAASAVSLFQRVTGRGPKQEA
jgi:capsid assembly protease